ncbi:aspartate/glutamate racemase family protein [Oceanobacillus jeddahense]|uniref:aspartate/glutamate racemase family protein n=1 Tax=Oceanobacillus jeddahense TaxID=1462527 RepID=UPI0006942260|nr:aspartate/glutamate racemase family protein [Oceanobacillus jeddahense]
MKIGIIHATKNSKEPLDHAVQLYANNVTATHFIDETLMEDIRRDRHVKEEHVQRIVDLLEKARTSSVDGIALACSSFTPYVDHFQQMFDFPIVSIDLGMLKKAVQIGGQIGIIATLEAAKDTTTHILNDIADDMNKEIRVYPMLSKQAAETINSGNTEAFKNIIQKEVKDLSEKVDVIVIAQMSITAGLDLTFEYKAPVLTGGEYCLKELTDILTNQKI